MRARLNLRLDCCNSHWSRHIELGSKFESEWEGAVEAYAQKYPEEGAEFKQLISGELPEGWEKALPVSKCSIGVWWSAWERWGIVVAG